MTDSYVPVTASPVLGADTNEIYAEWLGLSDSDLADLKSEGVV